MTEATKRPWDVEFAATKTYDLIYSGSRMDGTTIARVPWTGKPEDRANTDLIVKAVNAHDALVAALKSAEWAVPTPAADNDGSCPSCYAGKPGYGILATVKFERKNHMKICQLADALEAAE